ncbi:serine hydrolase [Amycolatopsis keratiniphila]|uniref:serine hydrolase n=1 Tax=Amycolatopsis keratiniphila TaxID=129921 RepID=UPI0033C63932
MSKISEIDTWLRENFAVLLDRHRIPGAAIAVLADGEIVEYAAGVLNTSTGVESTKDSVFQVGSITKVWTITLIMQLVDEGLVDLDRPVRDYLPEFRLADEQAAATITVRQLACHTGGFEGDVFADTGTGEDAVAKLIPLLADVPQLFPPGERFSYSNAGYCVLGRIVEVLRGEYWDDCVRERLIGPLGLTHAGCGAEDAIRHRAAVGHDLPETGGGPVPTKVWSLARSNAPAGTTLVMCPRDLLTFARMHLNEGKADNGTQVLSPASVRAMRERQITVPDLGVMGAYWGLGWADFGWQGGTVIGHDGGTIGQSAFLRVAPEHDVAFALLTNGGAALRAYHEVATKLMRELAGITVPPLPEPDPAAAPADLSRYVGEYSSRVVSTVVTEEGGRLWLRRTPKGEFAELDEPSGTVELLPWHGETFVAVVPELPGAYMPHEFVGDDGTGRARFLHTGRADRRVTR